MDGYIKKSEAVDVIVKYPYEIAGKTATAIKMIEDLPRADVVLRSELAVRSFKDAATIYNLQEINKKLVTEVERLRNILLQFTDIVHKWGAKNNIDTSEISLVPILQEEADSIIRKANQAFAREIFAEVNMQIIPYSTDIYIKGEELIIIPKSDYNAILAELEKKYTEGEDKPASEEKYFSPEDVRKMTNQEVREKYTAIRKSMERW